MYKHIEAQHGTQWHGMAKRTLTKSLVNGMLWRTMARHGKTSKLYDRERPDPLVLVRKDERQFRGAF
jgi:hypothetical protein